MSGIFILTHSEWIAKINDFAMRFERLKLEEIRFGVDKSGLYYIEFVELKK